MSVLQHGIVPNTGPTSYNIERSLRFNSADSAYLNRTPGSASNLRTFTISFWVKRSAIGSASSQYLWEGGTTDSLTGRLFCRFNTDDTLRVATGSSIVVNTTQVFRDASAWYHIVIAIDTTQATQANRAKLYINGQQVTAFSSASYFSQNDDTGWNRAQTHSIGRTHVDPGNQIINGYITEFYNIDGSQLDASSFGENDTDTGVWKPKAYTGSYGTNGFKLTFSDNSGTTSTTLGKDTSGNGNNWTPNNFSVTAGAGNDSLVDTPTPYGTDTGAGGEVRGNYATANPLKKPSTATLSNGNISVNHNSDGGEQPATFAVSSGKWYWEASPDSSVGAYGIILTSATPSTNSIANGYHYYGGDGKFYTGVSGVSYGATFTSGDVIGVALNLDANEITFYKNGVSQGAKSINAGEYNPDIAAAGTNRTEVNFGQRPFAYTAPSGFKALCTTNLPTPTIGATSSTRADDYFNTVLYTGNGTTQSITGVGFSPDLVWVKSRNNTYAHQLFDSVRGVNLALFSNETTAETNLGTLTAFGTDGFTVSTNSGAYAGTNGNTATFAAWNWKANGAGSSNTAGSITSTVSANTTAGFSIVTWTGNNGSGTVGHGLGVAPAMYIVKNRSNAGGWVTYHSALGATKYVTLNSTDAATTSSIAWNDTAPTSSVFSIAAGAFGNTNNYLTYCFAPVAGYSAFGSYTGNGSADGPFVYTGFRPAYVMIKNSTTAGRNWLIFDTKRNTYNVLDDALIANSSDAETSANWLVDCLSNGFKIRNDAASGGPNSNNNGDTYIYAAFAEHPFKYALAR